MANTENNVVTNGNGVDSDDEDLSKMRPVDIDQDVREMERRKRVTQNCIIWYQLYFTISVKYDRLLSNICNDHLNFDRLKLSWAQNFSAKN